MSNEWYFKMESDEYGSERFGPYDTEDEAKGMNNEDI